MSLKSGYSLRSYDPSNFGDVEVMNLMYYHPEVMKAKGYYREDFDFESVKDIAQIDKNLERISKLTRLAKQVMYSVVDEANNLVGWIWFYHESRHPLPKRIYDELGLNNQSQIFQVSYQKLMSEGWPASLINKVSQSTVVHLHKPRYGVIVQGLALALVQLRQECKILYKDKGAKAIFAYVLPDNISSAKVLERNGFAKYHRQYKYEGELNDLWTLII